MTTNEFNRRVGQLMQVLLASLPILALLGLAVVLTGLLSPLLGGVAVLGMTGFILYKVWRSQS